MCLTATETTIFVRQVARIHMVTTPGERGVGMDIQDFGFLPRSSPFHALRWIGLRLGSGRWMLSVLYRPLKGVVCYLLPSVLSHRVVRASRELLIVSDRFGAVVLGV